MKRIDAVQKIVNAGLVAVIRAESREQAVKTIDSVKKGGINIIEVTMTVPGAIDIIKEITEAYKNEDILIGAGTVLDPETARICILNGAEYIVSPTLNKATIKLCNRYRIPVIPGVMTVNEALQALEYGAEIIKLFPGSAYGPSIISAFKGPIPQGNFMPTGGVNLNNVKDWMKAGAVALGVGSNLTKGAKTGDYNSITETAAKYVEAMKNARTQEV